jgi:hypothetical protein
MLIDEVTQDPSRGFAPLIEELEHYGGVLTVVDGHSAGPGSRTVHLHLPADEYREKRCREVLREWHSAGS